MQTLEPKRLFFALWPDDTMRARVAELADALFKRRGLSGHPSRQRLYHLTLNFLGDAVPAPIEASAHKIAARIEAPPFILRLDKAGSFNNPQIPIWLGPSAPSAELKHLDQILRRTLKGLPVGPTPGFKPHITIMRDANRRLRDEMVEPVEWSVGEFVLIHSFRDKGQFQYQVLERYPLRGAPLKPEPKQAELF
ncbi:MAG: RNA 2',3'-cyclic phosphodiesterase [Nevskiales bacterium]